MCQIESVAHARLVSIHKHLAFLLQIRNKFIQRSSELQSVDYYIYSVSFNYVSQRFLCVLKCQLVLFFLFKLSSAKGATGYDTGTIVGFPLAAAIFTLHLYHRLLWNLKNGRNTNHRFKNPFSSS